MQNETNEYIPPLPKIFKPKTEKRKIVKKKKTPPFYLIKIRTTRFKALEHLLKSKGIKYGKKQFMIKKGYIYDVYVGGFYSYPQTIEFAKALKKRGYKIYSIDNIKLLYFVCIDKNISENKKEAYEAAWHKTKFRILFIKKPKLVKIFIFTFATANKPIINTLKKSGFYPIIKQIKNGA